MGEVKVFHTIEHIEPELPNPVEKHTAESKWQFCNCGTCQRKRMLLDSLPGKPIDYRATHFSCSC